MGFFDDYDIPCYSEVAYNPQMELYLCDITDMDISEGHVIGFRTQHHYGNFNDCSMKITREDPTKAINIYIEYIDLEPGADFLWINDNAQSTVSNKLVSLDQDIVEFRFTSDWNNYNFNGVRMMIMLGEHETGCDFAGSRSMKDARKPKSLMKKRTDSQ
ncbi:Oidioi.mRNA.OKI2018_I69.PAR.g9840.t1.cds [Oikopleura dioica]|uniref:Oidioi.mRNA.OKI2018_I69.PAR.g9840.t1.cds n=1 Tax=Oikopleura dioica TaxID=34765 RepID=A0ABN7RRZ5_OIKDI|nr:Oidioi.mRNA.OKI2018_I69.PAR.g9840.t1.cds [Oikopleura dioica]